MFSTRMLRGSSEDFDAEVAVSGQDTTLLHWGNDLFEHLERQAGLVLGCRGSAGFAITGNSSLLQFDGTED